MSTDVPVPPEREQTPQQALKELLPEGEPWTVRELSQRLGLSEKDVSWHLSQLQEAGESVEIEPSSCLACGFELRPSLKRPGRCPQCRGHRLSHPRFSLPS